MKQTSAIQFFILISLCLVLMLPTGCTSGRGIVFANREWHVSNRYGQIIDKDTTYRMTFGNVLIPDPLIIVSSADSAAKYSGMEHFLTDILHTAHLDSAEILFYAPEMLTMFVRPKTPVTPLRPSAISSSMADEKPYTMWITEKDMEDWTRTSSEMYSYTYFNKRKGRLIIVDSYDYGDTPIAQITIFQSRNKATTKMCIPETHRRCFWVDHDVRKYMHDIEFWAAQVEARRAHALANYKIGQEQKLRNY
ncbi:MAG: hypothetical protein K2M19_05920 [Muribaculaceae bacterium]|nr:hypothetical protein [Muribaculaceae bacterium]